MTLAGTTCLATDVRWGSLGGVHDYYLASAAARRGAA